MSVKPKIILATLIYSVNSFAIPCNGPDIRLDDPGKSMQYVPHSTQYTNDCYSYTAARAWDAYRFSNYPKDVLEKEKKYFTNPYQGALQYSIENKETFKSEKAAVNAWLTGWEQKGSYPTDYGEADKVLDFYMKNKSCVTDQIDHDLFSRLNGTPEEKTALLITLISDAARFRMLYRESYYQTLLLDLNQPAARDNTATVNPITGNLNDESYEALRTDLIAKYNENLRKIKSDTKSFINEKYCFQNTQNQLHINQFIDSFYQATNNTNNYFSFDTFRILKESIEKTCRNSAPVNINKKVFLAGTAEDYMPASRYSKSIEDVFNGKLNQPIQPIVSSIDFTLITDGQKYKPYRRTIPPTNLGFTEANRNTFHSQLIIGRRSVNGKCEYLIRDSAAPNCKSYHKLNADWHCDKNGFDIWIDAAKYTEAMYGITYIQDKIPQK